MKTAVLPLRDLSMDLLCTVEILYDPSMVVFPRTEEIPESIS